MFDPNSFQGLSESIVPNPVSVTNVDLQVLSNTRYKSVLHRAAVNGTTKRLSLACFLNPPLSATVEAPPELITDERPQVYRPFTWLEYLTNAYKFHPANGGERHERFFK